MVFRARRAGKKRGQPPGPFVEFTYIYVYMRDDVGVISIASFTVLPSVEKYKTAGVSVGPEYRAFLGRSLLNDSNSKILEILKEIHENRFKNRKCKIEESQKERPPDTSD